MKKKVRSLMIMLVFACVVIAVYYKMNNSAVRETEESVIPQTTVEKLLAKDLQKEYPATVKTVMKLYSEYSKSFYDGEYKEDELNRLLEQYRMLLDDELVANNPVEEQLKTLKGEINTFGEDQKTIISYYWPNKSEEAEKTSSTEKAVVYYTKSGQKYASTVICYTIKKGTSTVEEAKQKFVLRQDADGKWKILGWGLVNK